MDKARRVSLQAARRTTKGLKTLFGRLGSADHPRGRILGAYRNAHRGLRDAWREPYPALAADEVLAGLRREVDQIAREMLAEAARLGRDQARDEIAAWELSSSPLQSPPTSTAVMGWMAGLDHQLAASRAIVGSGGDLALVVGDGARGGILQPGPLIREGARWLTTAALTSWSASVAMAIDGDVRGFVWYKQAVAAVDERTTRCCLQVTGQAVPIEGQFQLTGTPRYADRLAWSPFHDYCRTSVVLVLQSHIDDDLTVRLRAEAAREQRARDEARQRAQDLLRQLAELGAYPDGRRRRDDTKEIIKLRKQLTRLRQRAGYGLTVD